MPDTNTRLNLIHIFVRRDIYSADDAIINQMLSIASFGNQREAMELNLLSRVLESIYWILKRCEGDWMELQRPNIVSQHMINAYIQFASIHHARIKIVQSIVRFFAVRFIPKISTQFELGTQIWSKLNSECSKIRYNNKTTIR